MRSLLIPGIIAACALLGGVAVPASQATHIDEHERPSYPEGPWQCFNCPPGTIGFTSSTGGTFSLYRSLPGLYEPVGPGHFAVSAEPIDGQGLVLTAQQEFYATPEPPPDATDQTRQTFTYVYTQELTVAQGGRQACMSGPWRGNRSGESFGTTGIAAWWWMEPRRSLTSPSGVLAPPNLDHCPITDLQVEVTQPALPVYIGDLMTFSARVRNLGPDDIAVNAKHDLGPVSLRLRLEPEPCASSLCPTGPFPTTDPTVCGPSIGAFSAAHIDSIPSGEEVLCTFYIEAPNDARPVAIKVGVGAFDSIDPTFENNTAQGFGSIWRSDTFVQNGSVAPSIVSVGDEITYTFDIGNSGPAPTVGRVALFLFAAFRPVEFLEGACGGIPGVFTVLPTVNPNRANVWWVVDNLPLGVGEGASRTCVVKVKLLQVDRDLPRLGAGASLTNLRSIDPVNTGGPGSLTTRIATKLDYYALGDSVAAGHGLPDGGQAADCSRSTKAYPYKVAAALGDLYSKQRLLDQDPSTASVDDFFYEPEKFEVPNDPDQHHHLACNGARSYVYHPTPWFLDPRPFDAVDLPGQLDALPTAFPSGQVTLVSITVGANDFDFVKESYQPDYLCGAEDQFGRELALRSALLQVGLSAQIRQLIDASPNVYVVLTDYFNPFNQRSAYFFVMKSLNVLRLNFNCLFLSDATLYSRTEQLVGSLNQGIADAANAADSTGTRVRVTSSIVQSTGKPVHSVREAFRGHESAKPNCGSAKLDGPLGNDNIPDKTEGQTFIQYPGFNIRNIFLDLLNLSALLKGNDCFHPNEAGAAEIAAAVEETGLSVLPRPPVPTPLP